MSKVSVIIPVYNVEKYLKECLDSVVNQTLKDIEIICVNNGSVDNSLQILEEYSAKDCRIKIIDKNNTGVASARNEGIKAASGEFIGFVDSDDWIELDYFEKLYKAAIEYNSDISYTNIVKFFNENKVERFYGPNDKRIAKSAEEKYEMGYVPYNCHVVNKIYNTKKVKLLNVLFEDGFYFEDMEWTHKILYYLGTMAAVPDTRYYYRIRENSITKTIAEKNLNDLDRARYKSLDFVQKKDIKIKNIKAYFPTEKTRISFLGLPLLKIARFVNYKYFYLFGFIPVFEIKKRFYCDDGVQS